MKQPGKFITFEGVDGCGKTTQAVLLAEYLEQLRVPVVLTREPGGTAMGREISRLVQSPRAERVAPMAELALMFAARVQHIAEVIAPALAAGSVVLCDRFIDSTIAYQGFGRGIAPDTIHDLDQKLCGGLRPGLTLVIDVDPQTAAARAVHRNRGAGEGQTRFEQEGKEFFQRVRGGYLALSRQEPARIKIIDGKGNKDQVQGLIRSCVEPFLAAR